MKASSVSEWSISWSMTILSGAVTVAVVAWVWFRISNRRVLRLCRAIPCAQPCYPVLGNALALIGPMDKLAQYLFQTVNETVLAGHRAVCFWIGAFPIVCVVDPDDIRKVLRNANARGKLVEDCGKGFMDHGLLTSSVDRWKVTRPHLNRSFRPSSLEQLMPAVNRHSRQLVADLSAHLDGATFNVLPHVMAAAVRSVGVFIHGAEVMEYDSDVIHCLEIAAELMVLRVVKPWLRSYLVFKLLYGKEITSVRATCVKHSQVARENYGETRPLDRDKIPGNVEYNAQTVLGAMRELQKRQPCIRDEHIIDEMVGLFGAGTDTTAASISSCLLTLARYPRVQERVYEEVCAVAIERGGEDLTYRDLNRLAYLDRVVKEALRMFPAAPFTTRVPSEDVDLGGYTLPADKMVVLCLWAASHDPERFPEPRRFDPDRFSGGGPQERALMPFGGGKRDCIGKQLATLMMKTVVAHVVRNYTLSTDTDVQDVKKRFVLTVSCKDGYNVSVRKRSS